MDKLKLTAAEKAKLIGKVTELTEKDIFNKADMLEIFEVCLAATEREYQKRLGKMRDEMVIEGGKQRGKE